MKKITEDIEVRQQKRPYRAPQLVAYGTVREITQATSGSQGNSDGSKGPPPFFRELRTIGGA